MDVMKELAFMDEWDTAQRLIRAGLGELQNLDIGNEFYFLSFQLLSQGFERFMKLYICLGYYKEHGKYPDSNHIKQKGHDLEKLLLTILDNFFETYNVPVLIEDRKYLERDGHLKRLLHILSEFGKMARYHNMDVITGSKVQTINPKDEWNRFEYELVDHIPGGYERLNDINRAPEVFGEIARTIQIVFERYMAALCRQLNYNTLGSKGKQYSVGFMDYSMLDERKYSTTNYRVVTTGYKHNLKTGHKRTIIDYLNRHWNKNYKYKEIKREEYEGEWPFYADKIIVECRNKHWCTVSINGYDYALNGAAQGRFKLENPHDAGVAIMGKSVHEFIQIALKL